MTKRHGLRFVVDGDADDFGERGETGGGFSHAVLAECAHADFHGAAADDGSVRHLVDKAFNGSVQNEDFIDSKTAFVAFVAFGAASPLDERAVFDLLFREAELFRLKFRRHMLLRTEFACAAEESLGHDGSDGGCDKEGFDTHIDESRDGGRRVVRVQRGKDQVSGQSGVDGDFTSFRVTDFTNHDDVGGLTQHGTKGRGEREVDFCVDLDLVDTGKFVFDRVFCGDDLSRRLVEGVVKGEESSSG